MELEYASNLIDIARREAEKIGAAMAFAVVDGGGHLVALARMDGVQFTSSRIAEMKAFTAAAFRMPSGEMARRFDERNHLGAAFMKLTDGRYIPAMGGIPVTRGGKVIGGIGASGGTGEEDVAVAEAAVAEAESEEA